MLQGFSGGTLIPAVFTVVFLLFPFRLQGVATTIAGVLAVLAPTVGPIVGGWITQTYSWHWLFLINILPGLVAASGGAIYLVRENTHLRSIRTVDGVALLLMALALAAVEIGLKQAPDRGWASPLVLGLLASSGVSGLGFVGRSLTPGDPLSSCERSGTGTSPSAAAELRSRHRPVRIGLSDAGLSGLRARVMTRLRSARSCWSPASRNWLTAPIAVALERRVDARLLTGFGFLLSAWGWA